MEPTSTPPKGRKGALNNPEILENVPGHVIPILEHEFDDFDNEAAQFLDGQTEETEFIKFRLKQGVYGQRQADVQMCRIKLPMGGVTPDQMDTFADVVEEYAPLNKGHITTRQNVQIHHIPLKEMAELIRKVSDSGLSSREGCGNTVRNVTGDPYAGVCADELFDITPWAGAYVRYFVRHPTTQMMPRKIKTAFTASDEDRAITGIHDIAFIPRIRDGVQGVEVRVGGGTSIMARVAPTLYDFVELENGDYLKVSEAVFRIFDRQDFLRVNRARARIKVLVDKIGMDAFRDMVDEELEGDWVGERDFDPTPLLLIHDEEANAPAARQQLLAAERRPLGVRALPRLEREGPAPGGLLDRRGPRRARRPDARAVPRARADHARLLGRLRPHDGRPEPGPPVGPRRSRLRRVEGTRRARPERGRRGRADRHRLAAPAPTAASSGITSSMGLNRAVQERIEAMNLEDPLTKRIHIKMSGCPNGCSQHHIANIGFTGASIKVGDKTIPAYIPLIGGRYEGGEVQFGTRLKSRLPAKRVPEAVERWIRFYEAEREEGEVFNAFAERVGAEKFTELAKDLSLPVEFSIENMNFFVDWNRDQLYEVVRGEGECAV